MKKTKTKIEKNKNLLYLVKLSWEFKNPPTEPFNFSFINSCFSNNIVKNFGLIGSAFINPTIMSIYEKDYSCLIQIREQELINFRTSIALTCNSEGIDKIIDFKINISDIDKVKTNENY